MIEITPNLCACGNVLPPSKGRKPRIACSVACRRERYKDRYKERYAEKRKLYGKARYAANRDALLEKSKVYYRENREARREYQQERNRTAYRLLRPKGDDICRMFELLPEDSREAYAWQIYDLSQYYPQYHGICRYWPVDDWLSQYIAN